MTLPAPTDPGPPSLRDRGIGWLRFAVPAAWGLLLTFLATRAPAIHDYLDSPYILNGAQLAVAAAWYALFRRIEHFIPAWLTRLILGANTPPVYPQLPSAR